MFHNCIIPSSIFANPNGTETGGSSFLRELDYKERREKCACSYLEGRDGWMDGEADTNVVIPQRLHSCVFLLCYCFFVASRRTGVCATFSSVVFSVSNLGSDRSVV